MRLARRDAVRVRLETPRERRGQRKALKAHVEVGDAPASRGARHDEPRRMILAGAILLAKAESEAFDWRTRRRWLDKGLTWSDDRVLLGLCTTRTDDSRLRAGTGAACHRAWLDGEGATTGAEG